MHETVRRKETNLDNDPTVETRVCTNNEGADTMSQERRTKNIEEIAVKKGEQVAERESA